MATLRTNGRGALNRALVTNALKPLTTCPLVGLSSARPDVRGAPFTFVKLPPTMRLPFGAAASVNTVPSSCGRNVEIQLPDCTSNAESHGCAYCWPPAPFCTVWNLPPTNIVLPTCASACAGAPFAGSGSYTSLMPTTPQCSVCGWLFGSHDRVCAAVPESGTVVKPECASSISGRIHTCV